MCHNEAIAKHNEPQCNLTAMCLFRLLRADAAD
jgi:hypothetical protein